MTERDSVVVITSICLSHQRCEIKALTEHGTFGVKTWLSTWGSLYPLSLGDHINVGPNLNLGCKGNTEDDKHPGSDLSQCQHRQIWQKCSRKD